MASNSPDIPTPDPVLLAAARLSETVDANLGRYELDASELVHITTGLDTEPEVPGLLERFFQWAQQQLGDADAGSEVLRPLVRWLLDNPEIVKAFAWGSLALLGSVAAFYALGFILGWRRAPPIANPSAAAVPGIRESSLPTHFIALYRLWLDGLEQQGVVHRVRTLTSAEIARALAQSPGTLTQAFARLSHGVDTSLYGREAPDTAQRQTLTEELTALVSDDPGTRQT